MTAAAQPATVMHLEPWGMGWRATFPGYVTLQVTRLKESSSGFGCELTVSVRDSVLEWGQFNLLAAETRARTAKRLSERVDGPWAQRLNDFCYEVVQRERRGPDVVNTDPAAKPKPLRYLLRPFLPYGMPTLLYGEGGTGKSTIAAAVALSVQGGVSVFPGWEIQREDTSPVLILDWEANQDIWSERIAAVAMGVGLEPVSVKYRPCRRKLVEDADAIAEQISEANVNLVIVDAVNQAFGYSNEHQDPADAANKAFNLIRQVSGTDITWLLIDHVPGENFRNQQNGQTPMKAYGSVAKQWLARQQFYLAGEREATETRQELVLKHTKANYSWKMKPLPLVIVRNGGGAIRFEFTEAVTDAELSAQLTLPQRIMNAVREGPKDPKAVREAVGLRATKADVARVFTALGRMVKRGELEKLADGTYQVSTMSQEEIELPPPADPDEQAEAPEDEEEIG